MPPTLMWEPRRVAGKHGDCLLWSEVDLLLIEVLRHYEDGLCRDCGQPLIHSMVDGSVDNAAKVANLRKYHRKTMTCGACMIVAASGEEKLDPGVKVYVSNDMSD